MSSTRTAQRRTRAALVHIYEPVPGEPPVSVARLDRRSLEGVGPGHAHSHDFLVLAYFQQGGGSLRLGSCEWPVEAGDVYVVAPGEVVGIGEQAHALAQAEGWAVSFPPEGLGPNAPNALLSWRAHPLLFPFARGAAEGGQRLKVPKADRRACAVRLSALERELQARRDGYREAVVAHLTLLLVDVSRLAADVAGDQLRDARPCRLRTRPCRASSRSGPTGPGRVKPASRIAPVALGPTGWHHSAGDCEAPSAISSPPRNGGKPN